MTKPENAILICFVLGIITGLLVGWALWHGKTVTHTGTTSNIASASAVIPVETIKYVKVYIHDGSGTVAASKAIIPIVPASGSMKVKGEFFEADVVCAASGSVDATLYNNQVYNASGTTTILQTASYSEKGQVIKPLTWWDYLVQYAGYAALALYIIFKG